MNYRLRNVLTTVLVCLNLAILTSCFPRFQNPLPVPTQLKADSNILGSWVTQPKKSRRQSEDDKQYLHIYARNSGWVDIVYVASEGIGNDKQYSALVFEGYTVQVNDSSVLCLRGKEMVVRGGEAGETRKLMDGYLLFPYTVSKEGIFRIWYLNEERVAQMIEKKEMEGKVVRGKSKYGGPTLTVDVTASSTNIESALKSKGVGVLIDNEPTLIFVRQEYPDTPNTEALESSVAPAPQIQH